MQRLGPDDDEYYRHDPDEPPPSAHRVSAANVNGRVIDTADDNERVAIAAEDTSTGDDRDLDPLDGRTLEINPNGYDGEGPGTRAPAPPATRPPSRRLGDILAASLARVDRRCSGAEKPIPLPWPILAEHFGGGFWPGLHILNSGTGVGKTQWALHAALHAAKLAIPILYVGLELGELDLALRMLGGEAGVPWSHLWTGKAGPAYVAKAHASAPRLADLPFHFEVAQPQGLPVSDLRAIVGAFRALYPEADGPGSRPLLVVVDFLQIIGDDPNDEQELRIRISRATYALRCFANELGIAVLAISSIARERYSLLNKLNEEAGFAWDTDANGCPINRRVTNPDAAVGIGKESGDLEYSADSVSILAKVPETWDDSGVDVLFATMKGRATGPMWSPLHFTGFAYDECSDRGGRILAAWAEKGEKRAIAKEAKTQAKDAKTAAKITADAAAVALYVLAHPHRPVREARVHAVGDSARRWTPAVAKLGAALVVASGRSKALTLDRTKLTADVASIVDANGERGHSPPIPPPPSTSTVDGPSGPTVDSGKRGPSTVSTVSTVRVSSARHEAIP